jgi:HAD superfamily phosphatase (TIGR01668 family)
MPLTTLLQPDLVLGGSILSLSPELLCRYQLKGLILDVDDTLVPLRQAETNPELAAWMSSIKGVAKVWLVSNNVNAYRISRIAAGFDVPYITGAGKPSRRKLKQALAAMQLPVDQVAMVGDRLFTDVLAGNRIGMVTILVEPMLVTGQTQNRSLLRSLETRVSQLFGVTLSQPELDE